jgi:hypothetical protein
MRAAILIGIGTGIASAVLFVSALVVMGSATSAGVPPSPSVLLLILLSPLPVAISGLGWGWGAAAISAVSGAGVLAALGSSHGALFHILAIGAPAALLSYLLLLNRPTNMLGADGMSPMMEWYPIGRVAGWAAAWAGILAALALYGTAADVETLRATLTQFVDRFLASQPSLPGGRALNDQEKQAFVTILTILFPPVIASMWFTAAVLNLWVGGHVTRLSGRLARPWPDLSDIALPPLMPLAFALAIGLTFVGGMPGLVASGFASALMMAFTLAGLAVMHRITRGMAVRPAILALVYGSLIFLSPLSSLIIAGVGLAEPYVRKKQSAQGPPGPPTS